MLKLSVKKQIYRIMAIASLHGREGRFVPRMIALEHVRSRYEDSFGS